MKKIRVKQPKLPAIERMLKDHKSSCKMHEYSLMESRTCTCGRDEAMGLYVEIKAFLRRIDDWLEDNDSLESNSAAHGELDVLLERMK